MNASPGAGATVRHAGPGPRGGLGPVQAGLFDFDGTLVDSERLWLELLADVLGELELPRAWALRFRGLSAAETRAALAGHGADRGRAPLADLDARYSHRLATVRRPIAAAGEFLTALTAAGVPCAVATNGRREDVEQVMAQTGLTDRVTVLVTIEDAPRGKPDPAPYLRAAELLGVDPTRAVVFEDSTAGARAGRNAGCGVVGVNPNETVDLAADLRVRSFAQLAFAPVARLIHPVRE